MNSLSSRGLFIQFFLYFISSLRVIPTSYSRVIFPSSSSSTFYSHHFPCPLFIWDGISALKYHLCRRLIQDNIYEGRGGVKFIRIRPGSLLDHLYPLSQHKPDGCIFCGHSFHEHLIRWWSPLLNTPFDLYLDRIHEHSKAFMNNTNHGMTMMINDYRYHDAYVVSSRNRRFEARMDTSNQNRKKRNKKDNRNQAMKEKDNYHHPNHPKWDLRQVDKHIIYTVPRIHFKPSYNAWERIVLTTTRAIVLEEMDVLIFLEGIPQ